VPLAGKMIWKVGEFSQEGKTKTNVRSHKPNAQNHYANFSVTLEKANVCFSKSLTNDSFSFLMPKASVKNHLLTQFNVYDPTAPTSSDCMGLRMYNVWPYQHMIAFGNENVKLADDVAEVLTGPFSLVHLINHHRGKRTLLEQLRDHKQQKTTLPQDLLQLELAILQKPRRLISFGNEAEPTLSFKDHLVEKIKLIGNDISNETVKRHIDHRMLGMAMAMFKNAEGDKIELSKGQIAVKLKAVCGSISDETINLYIENKMVGVATNPTFEQCIDHELLERINQKIVKRTEKVELLEGIVDTFKQMLMVTHPQKVAKFKADYPDLSDMFD